MRDKGSQYRVLNILIRSIFINYRKIQVLVYENHYRPVAELASVFQLRSQSSVF